MPDLATPAGWLPLAFMAVMGLAILAYVILDGFDLGVGILFPAAPKEAHDRMIGAIGPFWDANETWLVLGIGVLLVAFPKAHGEILGALYLPVAIMLGGLILRGVAFDFRAKAGSDQRALWDRAFFFGSLLAALAQGWMLGRFVAGFASEPLAYLFAALIALALTGTYVLLGATWLIVKTEGALQQDAVRWAKAGFWWMLIGILAISATTPLISERIFARWFSLPYLVLLAPIPFTTGLLFFILWRSLKRLPKRLSEGNEYGAWVPFAATIGILFLAFYGLAYSLFPYVIIDRMTIWEAAAAPESLFIVFVGALVVLPMIIAYTAFVYRIFRGKAEPLSYS
ncbi:MAG: cytochrome bd ubiquinol oxidase subunit II [Lysobacterales bacterium]|jgi:cytochrome d ubiquinol oxidase subunit II|nr:MAG: cytochrome bd ubiquinol oxidase subunit II [Xanthomonadales bacterium]